MAKCTLSVLGKDNTEKTCDVLLSNDHPSVFVPHTLYKDAVIMLESLDPKFRKQSSTIFRRLANFLIYDKESWLQMKGKEVCEKFKTQIDVIIGMCIVKLFYVSVFFSLKHFFLIKSFHTRRSKRFQFNCC